MDQFLKYIWRGVGGHFRSEHLYCKLSLIQIIYLRIKRCQNIQTWTSPQKSVKGGSGSARFFKTKNVPHENCCFGFPYDMNDKLLAALEVRPNEYKPLMCVPLQGNARHLPEAVLTTQPHWWLHPPFSFLPRRSLPVTLLMLFLLLTFAKQEEDASV